MLQQKAAGAGQKCEQELGLLIQSTLQSTQSTQIHNIFDQNYFMKNCKLENKRETYRAELTSSHLVKYTDLVFKRFSSLSL